MYLKLSEQRAFSTFSLIIFWAVLIKDDTD